MSEVNNQEMAAFVEQTSHNAASAQRSYVKALCDGYRLLMSERGYLFKTMGPFFLLSIVLMMVGLALSPAMMYGMCFLSLLLQASATLAFLRNLHIAGGRVHHLSMRLSGKETSSVLVGTMVALFVQLAFMLVVCVVLSFLAMLLARYLSVSVVSMVVMTVGLVAFLLFLPLVLLPFNYVLYPTERNEGKKMVRSPKALQKALTYSFRQGFRHYGALIALLIIVGFISLLLNLCGGSPYYIIKYVQMRVAQSVAEGEACTLPSAFAFYYYLSFFLSMFVASVANLGANFCIYYLWTKMGVKDKEKKAFLQQNKV